MAYLTAGTLDAYEEPDLSLEAAIVKVIVGNKLWSATKEKVQNGSFVA